MSLKGKYIEGGELVWVHFNVTPGQSQFGDYAYQNAYAKNRSQKIEDGETYIKMKIKEVIWKYNSICFNMITINKDGSEVYDTQIDDVNRMTLIDE